MEFAWREEIDLREQYNNMRWTYSAYMFKIFLESHCGYCVENALDKGRSTPLT